MAFRPDAPRALTVALAWRALLLGLLAFGFALLLARTSYYASALVVLLLALLVLFSIDRVIARAGGWTSAQRAGAPATQAREGPDDDVQALLDTVTAALIVLQPDGQITLANRAARLLAGRVVNHLDSFEAIGSEAALQLAALGAGSHRLLRLANGQRMLASAAEFRAAGAPPARLLSLQRVAGELDAVELQAWEDMTRVLAHEMMNSLTPIASLSESLEQQLRGVDGAGEAAASLEAIRRRSRGLMEFVDRYRSLAERPRPRPEALRLTDLTDGIERLMSATLHQRGITYRSRVAPLELTVQADRQLLEQALINLLRNAMDAVATTPQPLLEVSCRAMAGQVEIAVSDNGPGLDAEERDRIFVPFYTTKAGGSGIGLSLARYVALAHGGQLEVAAVVPQGTRFTLRLPG